MLVIIITTNRLNRKYGSGFFGLMIVSSESSDCPWLNWILSYGKPVLLDKSCLTSLTVVVLRTMRLNSVPLEI